MTIPQISGKWKGMLTAILSSVALSLAAHPHFSSWADVGQSLNQSAMDFPRVLIAVFLGWLGMESPVKPAEPVVQPGPVEAPKP